MYSIAWKKSAARLAAAIALFAAIPALAVKYVAVVEMEIDMKPGEAAKLEKSEVRLITDEIREKAVNNLPRGQYSVMTTETVMAQSGSVLEECAEENCVITLGSKIGADYIVRGKLGKFQTLFTLSVVIFDTDNGFLVASSKAVRSERMTELLEKVSSVCEEMYKKFASEQGIAPVPAHISANPQTSIRIPVQKSESKYAARKPEPIPRSSIDTDSRLTDNRDGKTYGTVIIGGRRWMAANVDFQTDNSWCYEDNSFNCDKYGRLYNWNAATTACPAGWRLPSRQEWKDLVDAVGNKKKSGKRLKSKRPVWNGTDALGFSALPGGIRETDGRFYNIGYYGYWWTSTGNGSNYAYYRNMYHNVVDVLEGLNDTGNGFSVRCIRE